eukprot:5389030-Prorocentrum_lima.AAC.1
MHGPGPSLWRGLLRPPLFPGRGIPAGCFAATYALKALLTTTLRAQAAVHPSVGLTVHVDDIVQSVSGASCMEVAALLTAAARQLRSRLEDQLSLSLAAHKC